MEIASTSTRPNDDGEKRIDYQGLGIREYWRFDRRVARRGRPSLAGDRLEEGVYAPIPIQRDEEGRLWGYSEVLGVRIYWEAGFLRWFDPVGERFLSTYQEAEDGRLAAEVGQREAEARVAQLEQEIRRMRQESQS